MAEATAGLRRRLLTVSGQRLSPNLVLMVRLVGVLFLLRAWWQLSGTFLPFGGGSRPGVPLSASLAQLVALALSVMLVMNVAVAAAAFGLGTLVLVQIASSRVYYENNRTFAACLLVLAGLSALTRVRLVQYQVLLLYGAAALNKLLDADWRSGRYMLRFADYSGPLHALVHHTGVPPQVVAAAISWCAILTEAALVVGFLVPRFVGRAIWLGLTYHTVLVLTTHRTFGMFWYLTAVSYLAFVTWPGPATVSFDPVRRTHALARSVLQRFDAEGALTWVGGSGPLTVRSAGGVLAGVRGALTGLGRVPAVPLVVMAVIALPDARWDYAAAAGVFVLLVMVAVSYLRALLAGAAEQREASVRVAAS